MTILIKKRLPKPSMVLDTYWKFACKRQEIFFNKIEDFSPFTTDTILSKYKFTNAFRASDRVSQYLLREVIYSEKKYSENDILLRILLFKIFNKIETWELISSEIGEICTDNFDIEKISQILTLAKNAKESIYSGAYIMASGKSFFGFDKKHDNHLKLLETHVINGNLFEKIKLAKKLEDVYNLLLSIPSFGSFLSFQYVIDINYSGITNFSEMDFVVAGPGAKDGIIKCFSNLGDFNYSDIIKYVTDIQEKEFERLELNFQNLWGRNLQLIDCQNLFCETDKYARVAHPEFTGLSDRKRIKQMYKPKNTKIEYFYPPKWNLPIISI